MCRDMPLTLGSMAWPGHCVEIRYGLETRILPAFYPELELAYNGLPFWYKDGHQAEYGTNMVAPGVPGTRFSSG